MDVSPDYLISKTLITIGEENKIFHDKGNFKQHLHKNLDLQKVLEKKLKSSVYTNTHKNTGKNNLTPKKAQIMQIHIHIITRTTNDKITKITNLWQ